MPWQVYSFALLPLVGATATGLLVRRSRVALGVAVGVCFMVLILSRVSPSDLRVIYPFLTGAAVSGLCIAALLGFRPLAGRLLRVSVGIGAAAATHWTFLTYALGTR